MAEWEGGFRTVYGELQFLVNNNGADKSHSQAADSDQWKALDATTGEFITPNGSGTTTNSVKVDCVSSKPQYAITVTTTSYSFNSRIDQITCSADIADAAKLVLRAFGLLPEAGASQSDYGDGDQLYFNNEAAERLVNGGGSYGSTTNAGVFYSVGSSNARSYANTYIGFRSAFAELPTA